MSKLFCDGFIDQIGFLVELTDEFCLIVELLFVVFLNVVFVDHIDEFVDNFVGIIKRTNVFDEKKIVLLSNISLNLSNILMGQY